MADEKKKEPAKEQPAEAPTTQQQTPLASTEEAQTRQQVKIEDKDAATLYANFCRVTGTPEELIIDFGLNAQPYGTPTEPIRASQRIVTNYYTAKRLLHALALSVQRHEQAFGVLETDVQKRASRSGQSG